MRLAAVPRGSSSAWAGSRLCTSTTSGSSLLDSALELLELDDDDELLEELDELCDEVELLEEL